MDEKRAGFSLSAPAASGSTSALRLPGRGSFPAVDDHLVEPEVTRDEIINGRRVVAMPAQEPHATQNSRLEDVLQAHVAPGYRASADLITRRAIIEALAAQSNPAAIWEREEAAEHRGETRGKARGVAASILEVLEARGIAVSSAQREEILSCSDVDRSKRRLYRAALSSSANEVVSEP